MRVNSVSFVFHFALKNAGISAQMPPHTIAATRHTIIRRPLGIISPMYIMQRAVAQAPMRICPSPPRFQNFILKAGVRARETLRRTASSLRRIHIFLSVPKAPYIIVPKTLKGFNPVMAVVTMAHTIRAATMAPILTAQVWIKGSSFLFVI